MSTENSNQVSQFGDIQITGNLTEGKISSIANVRSGNCILLSPEESCFWVEIESEQGNISLKSNEMEFVNGEFYHHESKLKLKLFWSENTKDSVSCNIQFQLGESAYTVRKIFFQLPGFITISKTGHDTLVSPRALGMRINNPANEFFKNKKATTVYWKDRSFDIWVEGLFSDEDKGEEKILTHKPSMMWLDYFVKNFGFYLGCHDPGFEHTLFHSEAKRGKNGIKFTIEKIFNRRLKEWNSDFVVGLHEGDWHRGSEIYGDFFRKHNQTIRPPQYIRNSAGLVCHYDFKWQDGTINHRFIDIPQIFDESREMGFDNLLIAGWNINGFDNNYPNFRPDPDLGTEAELIEAIEKIHEKNGKIFLYNNAYSFDQSSPDYKENGFKWAVKNRDGGTINKVWGSKTLTGMCNSSENWVEKVKSNLKYVIKHLKADGVYVDQLSMVPKVCYDRSHNHKQSWIKNNRDLIQQVRNSLSEKQKNNLFLFSEHCTDLLACEINAQMGYTSWSAMKYAFPEMFRYTFPQVAVIDQVMNKPWPANPKEIEEKHVHDIICHYFINGILFWTYDHVLSNSRINDFFKDTTLMRKKYARYFSDGVFLDDTLIKDTPCGVKVKAYKMEKEQEIFFAIWNKTGKKGEFEFKGKMHESNFITYSEDLLSVEIKDLV